MFCPKCEEVTEHKAINKKLSWQRPREPAFECSECGDWRWAIHAERGSVRP